MVDLSVANTLSIMKRLEASGFLERFLEKCGNNGVRDETYEIVWDAITSVFPDATGYYNDEIEVDTLVIFDPLIDEYCRLCDEYEQKIGSEPGESDMRRETEWFIYNNFDLSGYACDYDFRIYANGHGRRRLVVLSGIEFYGFEELPGALADIHDALEIQVERLRRELTRVSVEKEHDIIRKEAA